MTSRDPSTVLHGSESVPGDDQLHARVATSSELQGAVGRILARFYLILAQF